MLKIIQNAILATLASIALYCSIDMLLITETYVNAPAGFETTTAFIQDMQQYDINKFMLIIIGTFLMVVYLRMLTAMKLDEEK